MLSICTWAWATHLNARSWHICHIFNKEWFYDINYSLSIALQYGMGPRVLLPYLCQDFWLAWIAISWPLVAEGLILMSYLGLSTESFILRTLISYTSLQWLLSPKERCFSDKGWEKLKFVGSKIWSDYFIQSFSFRIDTIFT